MSKERKKLEKQLDNIFSLYIRERDNHTCIVCRVTNKTHVIQCGHLFSRVSRSARWDEKNANAQCSGCNLRHEHDFEPYRRIWVEKYGQDEYNILYAKWSKSTKFSIGDLKYLIDYYRGKLKELKEGIE